MHVDMDAFYASVEQRDHPELRGKPVVVGGSVMDRGVVAAASYEARKYGVRSAMSMAKALRLCPQAIRLPCNFPAYKAVSRYIHSLFRNVTPMIEPVSLDEAYLDISEQVNGFDQAAELGKGLKARIKEETQLNASIGIGPNKFIAKIASDFDKPDGFCMIREEEVLSFLTNLTVRAIPGVGQKTEQRLIRMDIKTVGELRNLEKNELIHSFGEKHGSRLYELARGIDENPVVVERKRKSLSQERTFSHDLSSLDSMKVFLDELSHEVAALLLKNDLVGRTVGIKVRFNDFRIQTRAITLDHPTREQDEIFQHTFRLLERIDLCGRKVRLLGIRISGFEEKSENHTNENHYAIQPMLWDMV